MSTRFPFLNLALLAGALLGSFAVPGAAVAGSEMALVNGHAITLEQIEAVNPAAANNAALRQQIAEQLVQQQLLADTVTQPPAWLQQRIDAATQNLRRQTLAQWAAQQYAAAHPVDETALRAAYERATQDADAPQYWLRWIVVKTPQQAQQILDDLRNGKASFCALALHHSVGQNAELCGALGWQKEQTLAAPILAVVRKLAAGQAAGPIALDNGFAIVQMLDKRRPSKPTLDQLKPQLEQELQNAALQRHIQELAKAAKIVNLNAPQTQEPHDGKNDDDKNAH